MTTDTKRYNLKMPQPLYDELERLAKARGCSVVDVLRAFIKLGIATTGENVQLIARYPDGSERELELII